MTTIPTSSGGLATTGVTGSWTEVIDECDVRHEPAHARSAAV